MDYNKNNFRGIAEFCQASSIILLVTHIYFYYFPVFLRQGWSTPVLTRILELIEKTGLFSSAYSSKWLALVLLLLSVLASPSRKTPSTPLKPSLWLLLTGLLLYLLFVPSAKNWEEVSGFGLFWYSFSVVISWLLILMAATRLTRYIPLPWSKDDPFGRQQAGFPQEERLIVSDHSLHLQGRYDWRGQNRTGWINLVNPRRGILITGSPGSGKSWFIIEPMLRQLIQKGVALFVYDFKYDTLTRLAWSHFQANRDKYPPSTKFYSVNFSDLSRSHRCNVLHPSTLNYLSDALDASRTILLSINKTWVNRQGDFFVESPINFIAALIWCLRRYRGGTYCTLPHVIELSNVSYNQLFPLLKADPEIATLIEPFIQAYSNKTMEMLDGQVTSARIPLGRLSSPELYYVLTGNDFSLDINNPDAPKIFCLGGDPSRTEALAPVLSLYLDRLTRACNRPGQYPCALVCDEFATVRAYNMVSTIATGRSNNIIPILSIQDVSQLRTRYSHDEANTILNICGNLFCGQAGGETARWASDRFPKILQEKSSVSVNSDDTSVSTTQQWEPTVTIPTISSLSSGEFVGIVADEPGKELGGKTFHSKIVREEVFGPLNDLPVISDVDKETIQRQFIAVKAEIREMIMKGPNYQIEKSSSPKLNDSE